MSRTKNKLRCFVALVCLATLVLGLLSCAPVLDWIVANAGGEAGAGQEAPVILPWVVRAVALSNTSVLVTFSDELDDNAVSPNLYHFIGSDMRVAVASLSEDRLRVTLTTSSQENMEYSLEVGDVRTMDGQTLDPAGATATFWGVSRDDTTGPRVTGALSIGNTSVLVVFSEAVAQEASYASNYAITAQDGSETPLAVTAAQFNESSAEVRLTTASQTANEYRVVVSNVGDPAGNALDSSADSATFTGTSAPVDPVAADTDLPRVVGAISTSNTMVLVAFSEAMADSVLVPGNYLIGQTNVIPEAGGLIVTGVEFLNSDRTVVRLTTLSQNTVTYQITAVGVTDLAGNPLAPKQISMGVVVDPTSAMFSGTGVSTESPTGLVDTDGDGLTDDVEQRGWEVTIVRSDGTVSQRDVTSDPYAADTDGDGLDDNQEHFHGTDPRTADTDGDLIADIEEINVYFSAPTNQDTDGDGINDSTELFFFKTSLIQKDTDGDGFTDYNEIHETNRDPRIADLPRPRVDVGDMTLQLDTRFSYTDTQGESKSTQESTSTTLSESDTKTYAFSDAQTTKNATELSTKFGVERTFGLTDNSGKVSFEASAGYSYADENTTTVSQQSSQTAQKAYQESLSTSETVDETQSVTRDVIGASMNVSLTIGNVGDIAFSMTNLEVTALQQNPLDKSSFLPVATLVPTVTLNTGVIPKYTTGPFVPERGPFMFSSREVFPSLVEDLMKNPRGLIFKVANFDVEDEFGRNLAFVSQEVNDRTTGLTFDYGNGTVDRFRVATSGNMEESTGEYLGGFDERGHPKGLPMYYVLQDILGMDKNGVPDAITIGADGCAQTWASGDDVQIITPVCPAISPGGVIITSGPNGRLQSVPQGDDRRVGDQVVDGGDGCAHTVAAGDDITLVQGACASSAEGIVVLAGENGLIDSSAEGDDEVIVSTGYGTQIVTQCDGDTLDVILERGAGGNGTADTAAAADDVQEVAVGDAVQPGTIIVTAGPNGVLETAPSGDDVRRGPGYACTGADECPNGICREIEILTRVKGVENNPRQSRFWVLLTEADINRGADFDDIILKPSDTFSLAYVQDKDADGLFAREEYIYGSSDRRINTDGCPDPADPAGSGFLCNDPSCDSFDTDCLTDYEEVKVGWEVAVEGQPLARTFANPVFPDSDADGVLDDDEKVYGTDASNADTDGDGISDGDEIYGFTIYKKDRETVIRHVDPWESLVIVDGGNGTVDTTLAGDDVLVNASPAAGDVIITPGPNGVVESIPEGDDEVQPTQVIIDGGNGVVESTPAGDDELAPGAGDMLITVTFESFNAGDDDCDADDVVIGACDAISTKWKDPCAVDADCPGEVGGVCQDDGLCDADSGNSGTFCTSDAQCTDQLGTCEAGPPKVCSATSPASLVGTACTNDSDCTLVGSCDIPYTCDVDSLNAGADCSANPAICTPTLAACDLPAASVCSSDPYGDDGTSCIADADCSPGETCVQKLTKYFGEYDFTLQVNKTDGTGSVETMLNATLEQLPINKGDGTVLLQVPASFPLKPSESFEVKAIIGERDVDPPDTAFEQGLPGNETPADWTVSETFRFADLSTNQTKTRSFLGPTPSCLEDDTFVFTVFVGGTVRQGGIVIRPGPDGELNTMPRNDDVKAVPHRSLFATDPLNRDTDGDGLHDGLERRLGANPNDPYDVGRFRDTDRDGLTDGQEKDGWFVGYSDAGGTVYCRNGDGDFIIVPDVEKPPAACVINTSDPLEPDTDGDGLPDTLEMMVRSNPRNRDTDGDSLFDYDEFDAGSEHSISYVALRDFKDLCTPAERCVYDPPEEDPGTSPFSYPYGTSLAKPDTDGDGLTDAEEVFGEWVVGPCNEHRPDTPPYLVYSDPKAADADLDGWGDAMEKQVGSDPNNADTDGDGTIDGEDSKPVACGYMVRVTFTQWDVGADDCDGAGYGPGDFSYTLKLYRGSELIAGPFSASDIEIDEAGTHTFNHASSWFSLALGQSIKFSATFDESDPTGSTEPPTWSFNKVINYGDVKKETNLKINDAPGQKCWADDEVYVKIELMK